MKRREQSQTEQLRKALTEREAQLQEAQARLAALEGSTSLQVGRALTAAAKRPGRGLVRLPRDLIRLWRGSNRTAHTAKRRRSAEPVRSYDAERQEARLLAGSAGPRDGRLVVAGVLSPEARAAVEPYVRVVPLRPHDAQVVFESVDADLLLVTASAAAPGTAWAHVGDPAAADRTRALRWIVDAAAGRGIPSVLVADAPAPPALAGLGYDLVDDGDLGIPLHRFNPVAAEPERAAEPVHAPSDAPASPAVTALLTALGADAPRSEKPGWDALPDLLRGSAAVVGDDTARAEQALVCGARTLLLAPAADTGYPSGVLRTVPPARGGRAEPLRAGLDAVRDDGQLTPEELRTALRTIFLTRAVPVRLAELLGRVALAPGPVSDADPLAGRRVALLAVPTEDTASLALADDVLRQEHPPAELVVPEEAARFAGVERLRSHGLPVRLVPGAALRAAPAPDDWAALANAAEAPWAALWREPRGPGFLADLLCAAECSGADAVGPPFSSFDARPGDTDVDWDSAGQDYVFAGVIRPELARSTLVRRALHPEIWNRHGARLLALAAQPHTVAPHSASKGNS
ncbi:hypothetical protein CLV63_10974 [Murinocardiopsis flavida]|uniref:Uncharacterized protein n=1 Tax=Murinocardiopsis flavida TaxID=645275 RepID=A0A2P8DIP8_9ACTN|nr:hypothetical protein [Murinocardiopsis flavida]PSK97071.1 hypothetical protein CLV63_10974 [Murinocardiopsis flavida]